MTSPAAAGNIADRIRQVKKELPASVRLIAVTKKFPAAVVRMAYEAGIRDFGESQVQEAEQKQAELADLADITWHLIGHLQSNKARKAIAQFQWIHSIDSLKLAQRLDQIAAELGRSPQCCLQVKLAPDPAKYGFTLPELMQALSALNQLRHLQMVGLMTIPPYGLPAAETQAIFDQLRQLQADINQQKHSQLQIKQLSMGMSGDYPLAIAAGATMIRLGTQLFGSRTL
ncbi:YggS family pyridoxal phosphate-dependent enzyme [Almyronema epifaneia]|uniref:Pyridoxal phosphate homeostasis protein n=1 Tax=Almyronema epifaneia S1 TaxID=2991925 RepID=A0ABW6IM15_9CYAN